MSVLVLAFAMIVFLLLAVVVSASRVYLAQRDLVGAADASAASAAQAVSEAAVYGGYAGPDLPLDAAAAEARVSEYVSAAGLASEFQDFTVVSVAVDGGSVSVTLAATAPMPFAGLLSADYSNGYPVQATATARSPFTS